MPIKEYIDTLAVRTPPETTTRTGVRPPSSEHIDFLMAMFPGQTRDAVSRALVAAHNDINRAVEIMLSGQPAPGGSQ
ncbi:hypothetical protein BC938DRAFT_477301 [Jimgerdemannia flammicorona]|uniref:UBA domain-containing protein n=1 Tax=Jimgerdemannia flammicorona TaxID=994334 RepID=A0A433QPI3_9FUNG|nr:hypothetical protein BC938DRAFT_477301 [Jimgerdemannia flammicorona]